MCSSNELNRQFSREIQMANKDMKEYSTYLDIKEMQIKTTLRIHLIPVKMTIINDINNNKCWQGYGEKEHKKLKIKLPYDLVIPLPGIYLKECAPLYD
jgi:hypothetical protein